MQKTIQQEAEKYEKQRQRRSIWRKFVRVMACVVVFCTTYALILPAITMEKYICGFSEEHIHSESCYEKLISETTVVSNCSYEDLNVHVHTADCYDEGQNLRCGFADFLVHVHDADCVDATGNLLCKLPQIRVHEHTEACYQAAEETAHRHDDSCYTRSLGELICQEPESETHTHAEGCYEIISELTCQLEEAAPVEEAEAELELICDKDVIRLHTHTDACYETYLDEEGNQQKRLICPELEIREHIHSEGCIAELTVTRTDVNVLTCTLTEAHIHGDTCYDQEGTLICQEAENHIHGEMCYGTWTLICGKDEHTHTDSCTNLTEEELRQVEDVISLIDTMPSSEQIDERMMELENAGDLTGLDVYFEEISALVCNIHDQYQLLTDDQKTYVTNADKLLALEYMWADMEEISTFAENTIPENFTSPVSGVNTHKHHTNGTELLSFDEWRGFVYSKHFLETATTDTYLDAFEAPANAANYDRPYYRCLVIKEKADGSLYVAEHIWASTLKSMTPKQLAAKLGDTTKGFFYITNAKAEFTNNAANGDYYPATGKSVEVYFNWKYFTEVNYWVANPGFSTINLNVSSPANIGTKAADDVHATLSLYNYDETINDYDDTPLRAMSKAGYLFFHDNVVLDGKWGDPINPKEDSVDGIGGREASLPGADPSSSYSKQYGRDMYGLYRLPVMEDTLDPNGFPQSKKGTMQLYFDPNGSYHRATMENGGGLFRKDSEGYWWYDSVDTAAYYDQSTNRFKLYNCSLVPSYTIHYHTKGFNQWADGNYSPVRMGNFLPFNDVNADTTRWLKPLIDTAKKLDSTKTATDSNLTYRTQNYVALKAPVDNWFGMTMDIEFYMPEDGKMNDRDMIFDFHGDDDVFVYIGIWDEQLKDYDYRLVLDIGGTHGARSGNINFATGAVLDRPATDSGKRERTLKEIFNLSGDTFEAYTKLKLKFYYMERGGNISYCRLRFNLPALPKKSLTVTKEVVFEDADQGLQDYVSSAYEYSFRVVEADANGKPTTIPFVTEGSPFTILEGGAAVGTGTVGEDGVFTLRGGQSAQFVDVLGGHGSAHYVVQELIDDTIEGQYKDVWYTINGGINTETKGEKDTVRKFTSQSTGTLENSESEFVNFRNVVTTEKLANLHITKNLAPGATFENNKSFPIEVTLGGRKFPAGAPYKVGSTTKNADADGIIWLKIGETAKIEGILAGTEYSVREVEGEGYITSYEGETSGILDMGETVQVTVLNADYLMETSLPIRKTYVGNSDPATFQFGLDQTDQNGNVIAKLEGTSISMTGTTGDGRIYIKYSSGIENGTYYYRIYEKAGSLSAIYDTRVYNVEVEVTNSEATITKVNGAAYDGSSPLEFVNHKLVNVPISKTVTGNVSPNGLTFQFTAKITHNGATFRPTENKAYTIQSDGTVKFTLKADETLYIRGVPVGATITITEAANERFDVTFTANGVVTEGNTVTTTVLEKSNGIHCHNEGNYCLPNTGGAGTTNYTMAGLVLMIFSMAYLLYRSKARRKGGYYSP